MAFLPEGVYAQLALAGIVVGLLVIARPGVPKAYGLGVLMMGVFLLDTLAQILGNATITGELGYRAADFLALESWWSPLTSIFVHAPPGGVRSFFSIHLIGNLLLLVTAGPALEERIGERRFLVVFFAAGFFALFVHTLLAYFTPITTPFALALGASGAIFGVLTAFAVRYPREPLPMLLLFFFFQMPARVVLLIYLLFNVVYMFGSSGIAWWGHFAGILVGLAFARRLPEMDTHIGAPTPGRMPDAAKLEPLATTPTLKRILERIRQFTPETVTRDDARFADAWLDEFFHRATCPTCGKGFKRSGLKATCESGETTVAFARGG